MQTNATSLGIIEISVRVSFPVSLIGIRLSDSVGSRKCGEAKIKLDIVDTTYCS